MKDNKHIQTFEQHQENLNISDVRDSIKNREIEIERCKIKLSKLKEEWRLMTKNDFNVKEKRKEIWRLQSHVEDMESRNEFLKSFLDF
jgi:predicted RNase H-like nuclease (RuvC/YqgF family)